MKRIIYFSAFLMLSSCASILVTNDYDTSQNFAQYTTYNYYPSIESGLSDLDNARIVSITDSLMVLKGFQKSDTPQLYINFFAEEYLSTTRKTIGVGIGNVGRHTSIGISGGIPIGGYEVYQKLTIDFIDIQKDALIWQAEIESSYNEKSGPQQKEKHYQKILSKTLKSYPPK